MNKGKAVCALRQREFCCGEGKQLGREFGSEQDMNLKICSSILFHISVHYDTIVKSQQPLHHDHTRSAQGVSFQRRQVHFLVDLLFLFCYQSDHFVVIGGILGNDASDTSSTLRPHET